MTGHESPSSINQWDTQALAGSYGVFRHQIAARFFYVKQITRHFEHPPFIFYNEKGLCTRATARSEKTTECFRVLFLC